MMLSGGIGWRRRESNQQPTLGAGLSCLKNSHFIDGRARPHPSDSTCFCDAFGKPGHFLGHNLPLGKRAPKDGGG